MTGCMITIACLRSHGQALGHQAGCHWAFGGPGIASFHFSTVVWGLDTGVCGTYNPAAQSFVTSGVRWLYHCMLSRFRFVRLFVTPWTIACEAPLSMGLCRQEYWSGLPCSPPGDLPDPGMELTFLKSPPLAGRFFTTSATWEAWLYH